MPNRYELDYFCICCGICFGICQLIDLRFIESFEISNGLDIVLGKTFNDGMFSIGLIKIEDVEKEMPQDAHLFVTCSNHGDGNRTKIVG